MSRSCPSWILTITMWRCVLTVFPEAMTSSDWTNQATSSTESSALPSLKMDGQILLRINKLRFVGWYHITFEMYPGHVTRLDQSKARVYSPSPPAWCVPSLAWSPAPLSQCSSSGSCRWSARCWRSSSSSSWPMRAGVRISWPLRSVFKRLTNESLS